MIDTSLKFSKIVVYLYRETYGRPFGKNFYDSVEVEIESCGLETVKAKANSDIFTYTVKQFVRIDMIKKQ